MVQTVEIVGAGSRGGGGRSPAKPVSPEGTEYFPWKQGKYQGIFPEGRNAVVLAAAIPLISLIIFCNKTRIP